MTFSNKTVFVTGATGFVGSRVAARLAGLGANVRAIVRKRGEHHGLGHPNIFQIEGDFTDAAATALAARGADYVFHCAATGGKDLAEAHHVNVIGTQSVGAAALAAGCRRMVQISTCAVYERAGDARLDEDAPHKKTGDDYSITKAEAERALAPFMKDGLEVSIVRPTAILGVHPTSSWSVKVPGRIREGKFPIRSDGSDSMGHVHVENVVDVALIAAQHPAAAGRAYNSVDGMTTWRHYAEEVRSWFPGCPPLPVIPPDQLPPGGLWKGSFAKDRIRTELGYTPRFNFAEGMAEARAWWRDNG